MIERDRDDDQAPVAAEGDQARPKVDGRPPSLGGRHPTGGSAPAEAPAAVPPVPAGPAPTAPPPEVAPSPAPAAERAPEPVAARRSTATLPPPARARRDDEGDHQPPAPDRGPARSGAAYGVPVRPSRPTPSPSPWADTPAGRRRLPVAPEPPFVACEEGPYRWEVTLPSAVGRKVTIRVGPDGLELGGHPIGFDEITSVRFKLEVEAALFRSAASARMLVALVRDDGTTVKAAARNALSTRRAEDIVTALSYLWDVLGDTAGPRQRALMVDRIGRGAEVIAGGLRLTRIGVAWKKHPIEHWSAIGDPVVERRKVVIPTSGEPIEVSIAADDCYLLPALIPDLRSRFA